MSTEEQEKLLEALAEALVHYHIRVEEIAKPLPDSDIEALAKRCRREAHPQPGDGHNFEMPEWDAVADLLERELRFRRLVRTLPMLASAVSAVVALAKEKEEQNVK